MELHTQDLDKGRISKLESGGIENITDQRYFSAWIIFIKSSASKTKISKLMKIGRNDKSRHDIEKQKYNFC